MKLDYEVTVKITVIAESESEAEEMAKDFLHVWVPIEKYEVGYAYHYCEECRIFDEQWRKIYQEKYQS